MTTKKHLENIETNDNSFIQESCDLDNEIFTEEKLPNNDEEEHFAWWLRFGNKD